MKYLCMTTHQLLARIPPHTDSWDRRACSHKFAGTVSVSMDLQKHEKSTNSISQYRVNMYIYHIFFCIVMHLIVTISILANDDHRYIYTNIRDVGSGPKHSDRVRVSRGDPWIVHSVPGIGVNTHQCSTGRTDSVDHVLQSTPKKSG